LSSRVTRKNCASGDALTDRIIAGCPTTFTALVLTSITAS
jgi:hypothetical protein